MDKIFISLAGFICHQIPDRSILINGQYLPFCSRCTGIYLGIAISFTFLLVGKRLNANKPVGIFTVAVASILMMMMTADGLTSYAGLRATNNFLRIISGTLFGLNLPIFYTLANNFKIHGGNDRIIVTKIEYLSIIAVSLATAVTVYYGYALSWRLLSAILCLSMVVAVCAVPVLILMIAFKKEC